jgi:hypothetical protein
MSCPWSARVTTARWKADGPDITSTAGSYVCMERIKKILGRDKEEEEEDWLDELQLDGSNDERLAHRVRYSMQIQQRRSTR